MNLKEFFAYGEKVEGYEVRVLNEREARAGAGILFIGAFIGLTNGTMLGTPIFSKFFVTFFALDFTLRVLQPRYSPSLLLGRFFVRNQKPEYVGATQKRFAWMLGLILAYPMFYYLVLDFQPNPIKVIVCLLCMFLLFFESAFSICFGCKIFAWFKRKDPMYCPGGVCEIQTKEAVQKFTPAQLIILLLTVGLMVYGTYAYMTKLETRSHFGKMVQKKVTTMLTSEEELKRLEEIREQEEFDSF